MGNRCSISVKNRPYDPVYKNTEKKVQDESITLFRHWGGSPDSMKELVNNAFEIMMKGYRHHTEGYPSEIIALLTTLSTLDYRSSAYLGIDENDGDNSDNGHYILEIGIPHEKELDWRLLQTNFDWDKYRESKYTKKVYGKPKILWKRKEDIIGKDSFPSTRLPNMLNDLELI